MSHADLRPQIAALMPELRGRVAANAPLADLTWFRVGGPAQVLFTPADEADLAYFLARLPRDIPVTVVGLGSNLLVRDGGVPGVVIRLGRGFAAIAVEAGARIRAGAAAPDARVAQAAATAGIDGLAFYRGVPGSIGGALRMNAGAHGRETRNVLVSARAVDRAGALHALPLAAMQLSYRRAGAPPDLVFTEALLQGTPGDAAAITGQMQAVAAYREASQPIRERTGGSTFKNPAGGSAWRLIDAAGCRGLVVGGAKVSEMHCNFLINAANATAEDIERLGETVRARVLADSGISLEWEIVRLGLPPPGRPAGEALVAPEFAP
jgi:UDP-N-acetylmuramate dehydrogenase